MVRHIILWKLKPEIAEEDKGAIKAKIKESLEALVGVVDGLEEMVVHIDGLPSSTADMMLESKMRDADAVAFYRDHPAHVKAATFVRANVETRLCLDFEE